jgi:hypothetical protein
MRCRHTNCSYDFQVQIAILCFGDLVEVLGNDLVSLEDLGGLDKPNDSAIFQLLQKSVSKDKKFVVDASKSVLHVCARCLDSEQMLATVLSFTKHKCVHFPVGFLCHTHSSLQ